ncbi:MAG: hypothetical protein L3K23_07710 [Thermoplasmata archaeon]|nr:hypothetical protein [Thermoplasmata archaeon]
MNDAGRALLTRRRQRWWTILIVAGVLSFVLYAMGEAVPVRTALCNAPAFCKVPATDWAALGIGTADIGAIGAAVAFFQGRDPASRPSSAPRVSRVANAEPVPASMPAGVLYEVRAPAPPRASVAANPPATEGDYPVSARILVHLYRRASASGATVNGGDCTQEGIARALGRPQSAFAKALLRLESAGLVQAELGHVPGGRRRVKIYRLTVKGEGVARRSMPPSPGR